MEILHNDVPYVYSNIHMYISKGHLCEQEYIRFLSCNLV